MLSYKTATIMDYQRLMLYLQFFLCFSLKTVSYLLNQFIVGLFKVTLHFLFYKHCRLDFFLRQINLFSCRWDVNPLHPSPLILSSRIKRQYLDTDWKKIHWKDRGFAISFIHFLFVNDSISKSTSCFMYLWFTTLVSSGINLP